MEKESQKSCTSAVEKAIGEHADRLNQQYSIIIYDVFEAGYMQAVESSEMLAMKMWPAS